MEHPLLKSRKLLISYLLFWLLLGIGSIFLQWLYYDTSFKLALAEAVIGIAIYPTIGLSIWFAIKYNRFEDYAILRILFFHLVFATIVVTIWLYLGVTFTKLIDKNLVGQIFSRFPEKVLASYVLYAIFVIFFSAINYYQNFKEKIKQESELKALVREAELQALKSQINPHFLFNSLNSVSSLTISNPEKAQEMVINLSTFMRYSLMHDETETVPFNKELENIKLYLSIEKVRFGKKLNTEFEISENCGDLRIPNMILQPLYENAIKYGVYETTEQVMIKTTASCDDSSLHISIVNDYDPNAVHRKGEGIGLRNIRQRLAIIYKNPDLLQAKDHKTYFEVNLSIPQNTKDHERKT
ncbi:MAG: histidine kinase [Prolixibacteraceae bacterium]|jgi:sensor histidine kinase YesM|nr:histidine kinase [Prolixibacteraceae bacterium]